MAEQDSNKRSSGRYGWVDVAKGICIVAVVCLYARREIVQAFGAGGWLEPWTAFAQPFRMPDFFLLSGLFLGAVINRPWRSYLDTKVVHYVYFLALWIGLIYLYDAFYDESLKDLSQTPYQAIRRYFYYLYSPDHMLWFIQTLPAYFVVTRLLRSVPALLMLAGAALLMVAEVHTRVPAINNFCQYYVFFLTGYLGASRIFKLADWVGEHRALTWLLFIGWIAFNAYAVQLGVNKSNAGALVLGFIGITAIISLSRLLSDYQAFGWLRYMGANSIVVYLGFYIPLNVLIDLYRATGWQIEINVLATLLVALSALAPVLLFEATRNSWARFLFERPRWARIHRGSLAQPVPT